MLNPHVRLVGLWGCQCFGGSSGFGGLQSTFGFDLIKKICPYNPKYIRFHVKSPNKHPGFLNQLPLLGSRGGWLSFTRGSRHLRSLGATCIL